MNEYKLVKLGKTKKIVSAKQWNGRTYEYKRNTFKLDQKGNNFLLVSCKGINVFHKGETADPTKQDKRVEAEDRIKIRDPLQEARKRTQQNIRKEEAICLKKKEMNATPHTSWSK